MNVTATRKKPKPAPATANPAPQSGAAATPAGSSQPAASSPGRSELSAAASALPAASTTLDAPALSRTPIASYGDIFRSLPGFNVANYGQGALGYGLSMRGYTNAEHGRDISYYIDGVPVNDVSSIHTPNYADLNILLPESVKSIDIIRGPFSVECGDSNLGGCINITTKRAEPFASAGVSGGSYGTARTVETYSSVGGAFEPFIALEGYHTDGYRDNSFINRYNSFNKVTLPQQDGSVWSIRVQAYGTAFGAPGYISRDGVVSGKLSPTSATNTTDGGNKYFENVTANYASGAADQELTGTLFVNHDLFNRFSTFTGDQRWQQDDRTTIGGRIRKVWTDDIGGVLPAQLMLGGNWRTDVIDTFQATTVDRAIVGPDVANLGINETNLATFTQLQIKPFSWLKLTGGGRFDQFFYDVTDNITPANSMTLSPGVTSPKAGIAVTPVSWLELYANYGQGFRSIDAATDPIHDPNLKPFKIESKEVGIQFKSSSFTFLADAWTTDSENESFQAAPGLPSQLLGSTRREDSTSTGDTSS